MRTVFLTMPPARIAMPPWRAAHRGMTLLELLIASAIALTLLGVAYYLFASVQGGVGASLGRAQVAVAARGMDARLRADFAGCIGPNATPGVAAGALLIIPGIREGYLPLPSGQMSPNKVRLRSDQLVFMTKMDSSGSWLNNGTPSATPWISLALPDRNVAGNQIASYEARIWYGAIADAAATTTDGGPSDPAMQANRWMLGRDCRLIGRLNNAVSPVAVDPAFATPLGSMVPDPDTDATTGSLALLANAACGVQTLPGGATRRGITQRQPTLGARTGADWSDTDYVKRLGMLYAKPSSIQPGELPQVATNVDLRKLYLAPVNPTIPEGVQASDLSSTHMRLLDNCSEIVVQWAGDLDKDGNIDIYPPKHPLAGSIIWYPEEYHATAQKTAIAPTRYAASGILTQYNLIAANPWAGIFPAGFTGPADGRFGGHGSQAAGVDQWMAGFQFDFGETDGSVAATGGGTITPGAPAVPAPYVFRFDDDQYRVVRFGFRQDGSAYKNVCDGRYLPLSPRAVGNHCFPYPPFPAGSTNGVENTNPSMAVLYDGKKAPAGPYPVVAKDAMGLPAGRRNFADDMGAAWFGPPASAQPFDQGPYRTQPSAAHPNGQLLNIGDQQVIQAGPSANDNFVMLQLAVGADSAAGAETILSPSNAYRSEPLAGYPNGRLVNIVPSDEPNFPKGAIASGDFSNTGQAWFAIKLDSAAATGTEQQINVLSYDGYMTAAYGPGNNYITNYWDIYKEYLAAVNEVPLQGTRADWRNPQSDWPRMVRIRVRLHDAAGKLFSYSDQALMDGRGDGAGTQVDSPADARISGIWYEFVLAVPYPRDGVTSTASPRAGHLLP